MARELQEKTLFFKQIPIFKNFTLLHLKKLIKEFRLSQYFYDQVVLK